MTAKAPSRKQLRKEQRKQKKARKNEYFSRGKNPKTPLPEIPIPSEKLQKKPENPPAQQAAKPRKGKDSFNQIDAERKKEEKELAALKKKMAEQRKKQLLLANEEEDRTIKKLEKHLKLNKRKSKGLPKMFVQSGLDYILEMCDPEQMKVIAAAEKKFINADDEFAEDLELITGRKKSKTTKSGDTKMAKKKKLSDDDDESTNEESYTDFGIVNENFSDDDDSQSEEDSVLEEFTGKRKKIMKDKKNGNKKQKLDEDCDESDLDDFSDLEEEIEDEEDSEKDVESESDDYEESEIEDSNGEEMKTDKNQKKNSKNTMKKLKESKISASYETMEDEETDMDETMENEETDMDETIEDEETDMDETMEDEESNLEDESESENIVMKTEKKETKNKKSKSKYDSDLDDEMTDEESDVDTSKKNNKKKNSKEKSGDSDFDDENFEDFGDEMEDEEEMESDMNKPKIKGAFKVNPDGTWEDIYGRVHAKDGSLMNKSSEKYIPPAVRAKMNSNSTEDKAALEKLSRLKKQLKGLLNRLAMSNMHNIAKQIENLYMSNSRNDMNETLGGLINESIISQVLTPERLLMEHILLVAVLHANIGTEVGAHFLQVLVSKFDENMRNPSEVEDKTLDNIVIALAQLYNFKVFDSKLMHEILNELGREFTEKRVDCILHVLRNVGFVLRKDDPLALKNFILDSNKKAAAVTDNAVNGSRLRFLLDVLTAIKNNNMTKIPNYDDSYSEHLKKIMKGFIRKGNYVTQLNISLEDLLKADERGKWWVVGSAWTGNSEAVEKSKKKENKQKFSEELLEMARKLRMNTDTRRDIFCVIMSADGYEDAFEKLMHLGLTKNQEREIIHVILHCCVKENPFNPYYAYLAQKFCEHDRKHMLTLKYSIWDKLKVLEKQSANCLSSLASLLIHLFLNEGLPISTLKVIQFAQMDTTITRFLRQIFLGILLHKDTESCLNVFKNVAQSSKLKMFRESLRLFLQLFVRNNLKSDKIDEKEREILKTRSKMIEKLLVIKDTMHL